MRAVYSRFISDILIMFAYVIRRPFRLIAFMSAYPFVNVKHSVACFIGLQSLRMEIRLLCGTLAGLKMTVFWDAAPCNLV